jgi:hypothetical protein
VYQEPGAWLIVITIAQAKVEGEADAEAIDLRRESMALVWVHGR